MVGGLVEQEDVGAAEQDAGELDTAPLAAGEGAERLVEDPLLQPHAGGDRRGLRLDGVAAERLELRLGARVAADQPVALVLVVGAHAHAGLLHAPHDVVQAARRQDAVAGDLLGVAGARVLRQVAHGAAHVHLAAGGHRLLGEDPGERGLAGAVAADEADAVALGDAEGGVLEQERRAGPDFETGGGDHGCLSLGARARGARRAAALRR